MLGYGDSLPDAGQRDIRLSTQADRMLAWLNTVQVDAPPLVGHDLGGGVAQLAAGRGRVGSSRWC